MQACHTCRDHSNFFKVKLGRPPRATVPQRDAGGRRFGAAFRQSEAGRRRAVWTPQRTSGGARVFTAGPAEALGTNPRLLARVRRSPGAIPGSREAHPPVRPKPETQLRAF